MIRYYLFMWTLPFTAAFAYEPQRAITNLAHELAECAGFYIISAKVFDTQEPELAERGRNAADTALEYSTALTNEKLTRARLEMAIKTMMKEIDNDSANFSILLNHYAEQCGATVSDPVKRLEYWKQKQD